jgi:hypothetical protein
VGFVSLAIHLPKNIHWPHSRVDVLLNFIIILLCTLFGLFGFFLLSFVPLLSPRWLLQILLNEKVGEQEKYDGHIRKPICSKWEGDRYLQKTTREAMTYASIIFLRKQQITSTHMIDETKKREEKKKKKKKGGGEDPNTYWYKKENVLPGVAHEPGGSTSLA